MKTLYRWMAVAVVAGFLAATTAMAGDCCKQTAKDVRAGKACEKCVTAQCCKDTAHKIAEKGKAKPCEKCAAKAKEGAKDEKKAS